MKRTKKPSLAKRIQVLNERAKVKMHDFFGSRCICCGLWRVSGCTIHHGIFVSQSWYHRFTPMNWHWICNRCHTIATKQGTLYLSMLDEVRPELVAFILSTPRKRHTCKRTAGAVEMISQWMVSVEKCQTYEELCVLPTWQEVNGINDAR